MVALGATYGESTMSIDFTKGFEGTIDGGPCGSNEHLEVINPATGKAFASAPAASAGQLDKAVAAANDALPGWKALGTAQRGAALAKLADAIEANSEGFTALFTREQGRPLAFAAAEIALGAQWLRAVASQDIPVEIVEDSETRTVEVHHVPLGVVCAIVPWNFPFLLAIWKIAPALLAGNTMVLKPSPFTPLCALKLGELARGVIPDGVLNVLSGGDALGPLMTAHPGFAKISFTGSTATGKRVMEAAAKDLKRVTLELGGNDAAIIMPDVDVDAVAEKIFMGAFYNSAQVCIATKRLYIHEDIYDALRDRLHAIAQMMTVGDGADDGVMFGPVQNAPQYQRVMGFIAQAEADGLKLLRGRDVPEGEGYFVPITLVDNPPETAQVVTEEAFGPVLPLMRFSDIDELIGRANNSEYGLAGAVWSKDIEQARAIAARLDTGTVWINQNLQSAPHIPFSGAKQSGLGVENGQAGLLEFTQRKTIFVPKAA